MADSRHQRALFNRDDFWAPTPRVEVTPLPITWDEVLALRDADAPSAWESTDTMEIYEVLWRREQLLAGNLLVCDEAEGMSSRAWLDWLGRVIHVCRAREAEQVDTAVPLRA